MAQVVLDALKSKFSDDILETTNDYGDEVATIDRTVLVDVVQFLRDDERMAFDQPAFVTCIDRFGDEGPRFEVVYQLRSFKHRHRIRLRVKLEEEDTKIPTLTGLYPAFNWLERETYDMYGIEFQDHPDLRRIYMYEEFVGFPLRKDYPKEKRQPLVRREWTDE